MSKGTLCCQADTHRRIWQVPMNGIPNSITTQDEFIAEVKGLNLSSDHQIRDGLLKKVMMYFVALLKDHLGAGCVSL